MRQLLAETGGGLQAGVIGASDLKAAQRGAGANMSVDVPAGAAWVAVTTGTRNGLAHVYNDAIANVVVTASNATNPRIDSILLRYNDSTVPTGSGSTPTLEVSTGTPTAGATLDNRTGAATPTGDFLRLADILVPATSTSVTTANIRDRRPWARGAYNRLARTTNTASISVTTMGAFDTTNLQARIEATGNPFRASLQGTFNSVSAAAYTAAFDVMVDSVAIAQQRDVQVAASVVASYPCDFQWEFTPAAGSHLITPGTKVNAQSITIVGAAPNMLVFTIEELVRPNTNNGTA